MLPISKVLRGRKEFGHQRKGIRWFEEKQQQVQRCVGVKEHGLLEERGSGSDWLEWTMYACACVYTYICLGDREGVRRSSERRGVVRLCNTVNAVVGSSDFILQESVNQAERFRG